MFVSNYDNEINVVLQSVASFTVFNNGKENKITKKDEGFGKIYSILKSVFSNCRVVPAFGVSLHQETLNEMQEGLWLQINFDEEMCLLDLPFISLLLKMEKCYGTNLIRKNNNRYEGRCIYLDFTQEINLKELFIN